MDINLAYTVNNLAFDRFFDEKMSLPYSFENIKIESNDISNYKVINDSIYKLNYNFLYLYGKTQFLSNVIPVSSKGIYGNYNTSSWFQSTSTTLFSTFNSDLDNINFILPRIVSNNIELWVSNTTSITNLDTTLDFSNTTIVLSTNQTDYNSSYLFKNISGIVSDSKSIIVLDSLNNSIFKYNITNNRLMAYKIIGGFGDSQNNFKFNNPTSIAIQNGIIYILDTNNRVVKIYDNNLNWLSTHDIKQFTNESLFQISVYNDIIYIITAKNTLLTFDLNFKLLLSVNLQINDTIKNIFFSKTNNNVFYIVTTKNIYKRYTTKPIYNIGVFLLNSFFVNSDELFQYGESVNLNGLEYIFVASNNNISTKIINFIDMNVFISILTETSFDIDDISDINAISNEYNQVINYNNMFQGLLKNHILLQNRLSKVFVGNINNNNDLIFITTQYITNFDYTINYDLNFFIGQNEAVTNSVINRCFEKLYNIQSNILNILSPVILNTTTSLNTPIALI